MKYPVISLDDARSLWEARLSGQPMDVEGATRWSGEGEYVDLALLESLSERLADEIREFGAGPDADDQDMLEGRLAAGLHRALRGLPLITLDDPGFWRFVSIAHLPDFVVWRQASTFEPPDWSKYRKYVDGTNHAECVAVRMFLRGQIALRGDDDYSIAYEVSKATDLWRSHIVRVRTSYSPLLARALVEQQAADRMNTGEVREYAKRINRLASNVVLHSYDADEIDEVLHELRDQLQSH